MESARRCRGMSVGCAMIYIAHTSTDTDLALDDHPLHTSDTGTGTLATTVRDRRDRRREIDRRPAAKDRRR